MAVNKKNIMTRYFFVVLVMGLLGIAIVVKAAVIMFAERQYWQDVADRFVKENSFIRRQTDGKFPARISYIHGLQGRRRNQGHDVGEPHE